MNTLSRQTKYTTRVENYMTMVGHATNAEILNYLRSTYPSLSSTTVHRITARMLARQRLILGPTSRDNYLRYDINVSRHDHFQCRNCDQLRDINIPDNLLKALSDLTKDCQLSGPLVINGICSNCLKFNHCKVKEA